MARFVWVASCIALTSAAALGCTALVDGTLAGRGGTDAGGGMDMGMVPDTGPMPDTGVVDMGVDTGPMPDAGPASPCAGMPDGLRCTMMGIDEPFVCIDGVCVLSTCGDAALDTRVGSTHVAEACDDGNSTPGDGCEPDCTFSCTAAGDCDDGESCNGAEVCDAASHTCGSGTMVMDLTPCTVPETGTTATCHAGVCRAGICPDGNVDAGEECDDSNLTDGDGCDADCTFTCVDDFACVDADACNGNETCDVATHTCMPAAAMLDCNDMDDCTTDTCDTTSGCVHTPLAVDADMDGHAAVRSDMCGGDDCDDTDVTRFPGAVEPCGSMVDLNCDGAMGAMTTYYRDCDGDDYAASTTGSTMACTEPAAAGGCSGGWTTRVPGSGSTDCLDTSVGASVHPGQAGYFTTNVSGLSPTFDYNCSGSATRQYANAASGSVPHGYSTSCGSGGRLGTCTGDEWYVASLAPSCGASATLSYCAYSFTTRLCSRTTTSTTVACH